MSATVNYNFPVYGRHSLAPVHHTFTGDLGRLLDSLNEQYSFVLHQGAYRAYHHPTSQFIDINSVKTRHKEDVSDGDKVHEITKIWFSSPKYRRHYNTMVFRPYGVIHYHNPEVFNTWFGWGMEPARTINESDVERCVQPWLDHIKSVFCSNNEEQYNYFVKWLAHMFQYPEQKPGVAIIVQTGQGYGKGLFMTMLEQIVGYAYTARITETSQVAGGFSGHMRDKLLVNLDEATWGGDKRAQGRLKAVITERRLMIEAKHSNPEEINHYARFLITTNSSYPVPVEVGDRRYFVPDTSMVQPREEHFKTLIDINNDPEALAVIFKYFLSVDLKGFNIARFPTSEQRKRLQQESVSQNDMFPAFLLAAYDQDPYAAGIIDGAITGAVLYEHFLSWKKTSPFKDYNTSIRVFGNALKKMGVVSRHTRAGTVYDLSLSALEETLRKLLLI